MGADRMDGNPQDFGNLLGAFAIAHQRQDFSLARGKMVFHSIDMVTLALVSSPAKLF